MLKQGCSLGLERLGLGLETQTSRDLAFRETFRLNTIYVELKLQTESNKWKSCVFVLLKMTKLHSAVSYQTHHGQH